MATKSNLYTISIPKWDEHNKSKKKNHRYFLIENRIFNDDKISQLNAEQTRLYLYLLSVASDLNTSSYTFHVRLLPSYFRVREQLLHSCLKLFESLQLLRYEKSVSNTIENNTKEDKIKEKKLPARQKNNDQEKLENKKIRDSYFNAYRLRYGIEPVSNATFNSQVSSLRKKLGVEDSVRVVEFYLKHHDAFYLKNTHSFGLCLANADTLRTQMLRGKPITSLDVRNFEKTQNAIQLNESIRNGENF